MRPLFASAITAFPLIALGACLFDGPSETPSDAGISPIEAGRDVLDPGDAQEGAAPVAAAVGPAGGEVTSTDGARVVVPAGAVADDVTITLTPTTPPPNNTGVVGTVASPVVRLGPEGQSFTVPVFVTLPVDLARLPPGTRIADLRIFRAPAGTGAFEAIPTGVVGNGTSLTAATTHFSDFVVALPSSPGPACFDATKNGAETDTDCGGACNACEDGKACISPADCRGFSCNGGVCATGIKAVALGKFHSCVVLSDGRLKCWGLGAFRTGSGGPDPVGGSTATMGAALAAVDLGGRKAVDVAVGQQHTCVLLEGGEVACWGAGGSLLGVGDTRDRGGDPGDFGAFLGLATFGIGRKATAISFGASHACALLGQRAGQVLGGEPRRATRPR